MISKYKFYSFFTKYSLMEDYGFITGFLSRIFRKFIPEIPAEDTFEYYLKSQLDQGDNTKVISTLNELLSDPISKASISDDLNKAILAISSKIVSFGFDHKFQAIFEKLNIDSSFYKTLLSQISTLSEESKLSIPEFQRNLNGVYLTIIELRKNKNMIGTSLHLTVVTKNLLNYIKRTKKLLDLKSDIQCEKEWERLIDEHIQYDRSRNSLSNYFSAHVDLLALEIVEHTAQKGEKYVADNKKEYKGFFKKGLIGGFVISIFALVKIIIDAYFSADLPLAMLFSINYALCFIIVSY